MTDDTNPWQVHRCAQCGKPTPEKLAQCRHCQAPQGESVGADWWSRTFDNGPAAKKGCLVFMVAIIVGLFLLVGRCAQSRQAAERAEEAATVEQNARDAAEQAENRRKGFHCLSPIDGSEPDLVAAVKQGLRDPDSYQHIETRVTPVDASGKHQLMMHYRARNGFGGMMDGVVTATVDPRTCAVRVLDSE